MTIKERIEATMVDAVNSITPDRRLTQAREWFAQVARDYTMMETMTREGNYPAAPVFTILREQVEGWLKELE
jgi:hypothetical protein